jgi:orotate phosphoribosyltransferase
LTKFFALDRKNQRRDNPSLLKRGFDKRIPGSKVLVVEDVLTSGGSARRTIEVVSELGGEVIGLGVLCNRGNVQPDAVSNIPITAILDVQMRMYPEEDCPFCAAGTPVRTDFGKGAEFLKRKGK